MIDYLQVIRYKQNVVKHDSIEDIICPEGTAFLQFVGDNTDHDIATIDGKNTHHGLGSIAIANGNFSDKAMKRAVMPREKKVDWTDVPTNAGIPIKQFFSTKPALKQLILKPVKQEIVSHKFRNLLWACAHIFNQKCPGWSGYMSLFQSETQYRKSKVSFLTYHKSSSY